MRTTKQQKLILKIINESFSHPTAYDIYIECRKNIPNISLGTVYRNLNLLADQKRILRLDVGDGAVHFDARLEPHYHMVCDECGSIQDLFLDETLISPLIDKVQQVCDDQITSAEILFHGTCRHCLKKKH